MQSDKCALVRLVLTRINGVSPLSSKKETISLWSWLDVGLRNIGTFAKSISDIPWENSCLHADDLPPEPRKEVKEAFCVNQGACT